MEQHLQHEFPSIEADDFWQMYFLDEQYGQALHRHLALRLEKSEIETRGEGDTLHIVRKTEMVPDRNIPVVIDKVLKGARVVKECSTYDAKTKTMTLTVGIPTIGRLIDYGGQYRWTDRAGGGFVRTWKGYCNAKIPLVGRKFERFLLDEMEKGLQNAFEFTVEYLEDREA
jgi:hypothetical protein